MRELRLLDLFSGEGGCAEGYWRAGFSVICVDRAPMPNNPFTTIKADWREYVEEHGHKYDVIHASPVCKGYAGVRVRAWEWGEHKLEIPDVREALKLTGKPYVIENIESAGWAMHRPIRLCGSSFGLRVRRHRLFESNMNLAGRRCEHAWQDADKIFMRRGRYSLPTASGTVAVYGTGSQLMGVTRAEERQIQRDAMGIDWMTHQGLTQAIPPAYTEYIGRQLLAELRATA